MLRNALPTELGTSGFFLEHPSFLLGRSSFYLGTPGYFLEVPSFEPGGSGYLLGTPGYFLGDPGFFLGTSSLEVELRCSPKSSPLIEVQDLSQCDCARVDFKTN